jgi:hypothetical protein
LLFVSLRLYQHKQLQQLQITIGYCNFDSILNLMPGYRSSADSMEIYGGQLKLIQAELSGKQHEFDSLNAKWSPTIAHIKNMEMDVLKTNIENLKRCEENMKNSILKLDNAMQIVVVKKGYTAVLDSEISDAFVMWSAPGTSFENITKYVCAELDIK